MASVIPINLPFLAFDFDRESRTAAVNEACAGEQVECTLDNLCVDCDNLAKQISVRLQRAFLAGQAASQTQLVKEED